MTRAEWEDQHRCHYCGDPLEMWGVVMVDKGKEYHSDCFEVRRRRIKNGKETVTNDDFDGSPEPEHLRAS